ncbi:MAG TPA: POTRA domain-containing protein [Pyrinomonadaceae bacterium]|nr:POTRA domain-containing protein [Pyrinomonadaceae bacterium]
MKSCRNQLRSPLLLIPALFLISSLVTVRAQEPAKIGKIEFEGLKRYSTEEVLATSTLKVGEAFDVATLDSAAQKLADSGLFKNVAYRTRNNKGLVTITFQIEETSVPASRVIFDNFIWFTDTELIAAIKRDVPSFSGTAPDNGDIADRITRSLQTFLHENKIEASVSYLSSQDSLESAVQEHVFSVNGIPMPMCTLHFPGATNISEQRLIENSKTLIGGEYSSKFVSIFTLKNLFPLYREAGQLKAAFSPPLPKPEATATCKSGVEVTLPVDEGSIYKLGTTKWSGNTSLSSSQLDALLSVKSGQIANGVRLDKDLAGAQKAYGRQGFLLARIRPHPEFEDGAQIVNYSFDISEGPQFRMGKLILQGFGDSVSKQISEHWRLKTGEIFDNGYEEEFLKNELGELLRPIYLERRSQGKPAPSAKSSMKLNRETLTVDLTLELAN